MRGSGYSAERAGPSAPRGLGTRLADARRVLTCGHDTVTAVAARDYYVEWCADCRLVLAERVGPARPRD